MKRIFAFLLLLTGALPLIDGDALFAQSTVKIRGKVLTADHKPLPGAQVVVLETGHGAVSDVNGWFFIEDLFAGEYTLVATHMGYHDQQKGGIQVEHDLTAQVDFILQHQVLSLPGVTITARSAEPRSGFLTVLTANEIAASQAFNVTDLLAQQPGVEILDDGSGVKGISIRGSDASQVLVLLDGVPVNSAFKGDMDLNQIPLSQVERIVIQRGGGSHRLGSGALAGAVEITSKTLAKHRIRLKGHWGAYGNRSLQATLSGGRDEFRILANLDGLWHRGDFPYSYVRIDGSPAQDIRVNADLASRGGFGKLDYSKGLHHASMQLSLSRVHRGLPGLVYALTPYGDATSRRSMIQMRHGFRPGAWHSEFLLSSHTDDSEYVHMPPSDAPPRFRTVPPYHSLNRQNDRFIKWELTRGPWSTQFSWRQVHFVTENRLAVPTQGPNKTDHRNLSWAMSYDLLLTTPGFMTELLVQPALRYDHLRFDHQGSQQHRDEFSPHLALVWSHRGNTLAQLKGAYSRSFRAPSFADLFFQDFRTQGNPDLLPEIGRNWDFGVRYGVPFWGWFNLEAEYFHQDIDNYIVWELGSFATFRPSNSKALLRGFEFQMDWSLGSDKAGVAWSHSIIEARNRSGDRTTHDKFLTYRPSYSNKLQLRFAVNSFELIYAKRWVGRRFVTSANTIRLPPYSLDDLSVRWRRNVAQMEMKLFFAAANLFDQAYEITERAPQPGRTVRAGLEFQR